MALLYIETMVASEPEMFDSSVVAKIDAGHNEGLGTVEWLVITVAVVSGA